MNASVRINLIVEGLTEKTFVDNILQDHFASQHIYLSCRLVTLGASKGGFSKKHGYKKPKGDILRWLNEDKTAFVTTMFDFYGLPSDFPGMSNLAKATTNIAKVELIETALKEDINNDRFIPYIQLHEFEALLFSDIEKLDETLTGQGGKSPQLSKLEKIMASFESPEDINDSILTAPSKRLEQIYSKSYQKVVAGRLAAKNIGISKMLEKCKHFSSFTHATLNFIKD
jgi:hypothetical protein